MKEKYIEHTDQTHPRVRHWQWKDGKRHLKWRNLIVPSHAGSLFPFKLPQDCACPRQFSLDASESRVCRTVSWTELLRIEQILLHACELGHRGVRESEWVREMENVMGGTGNKPGACALTAPDRTVGTKPSRSQVHHVESVLHFLLIKPTGITLLTPETDPGINSERRLLGKAYRVIFLSKATS